MHTHLHTDKTRVNKQTRLGGGSKVAEFKRKKKEYLFVLAVLSIYPFIPSSSLSSPLIPSFLLPHSSSRPFNSSSPFFPLLFRIALPTYPFIPSSSLPSLFITSSTLSQQCIISGCCDLPFFAYIDIVCMGPSQKPVFHLGHYG